MGLRLRCGGAVGWLNGVRVLVVRVLDLGVGLLKAEAMVVMAMGWGVVELLWLGRLLAWSRSRWVRETTAVDAAAAKPSQSSRWAPKRCRRFGGG